MFQLHQIVDRTFLLDDQCIFINAFVHPIVSHNLCAVQPTVFRREGDLDIHLQSSRIVSGMRTGVNGSRQVRNAESFQAFSRKSGRSHGQIEHLGNGRTNGTFIFHFIAKRHIISYDTCLTVGRPCQEIQPGLARNRMRIFNGIAYRIN